MGTRVHLNERDLLCSSFYCLVFWSADLLQDRNIIIKSQDGATHRCVEKSRLSEMSANKEAEVQMGLGRRERGKHWYLISAVRPGAKQTLGAACGFISSVFLHFTFASFPHGSTPVGHRGPTHLPLSFVSWSRKWGKAPLSVLTGYLSHRLTACSKNSGPVLHMADCLVTEEQRGLGNKSWPAQALWCDWRAVSGSFGQQKSISLTSELHAHITHTHAHTHTPRGSVLAVSTLLPTDKRQTQREAANYLDRQQQPSAQSPNICFTLLRFAFYLP